MHGGMHDRVYRGPDRRQEIHSGRRPMALETLVALVVCAATVSVAATQVAGRFADVHTVVRLSDALRAAASGMFFGAGVMRYARWRLTGEAPTAYMAASLLVFGGLTAPLAMVSQFVNDDAPWSQLSPITRALTTLAAFGLLIAARRSPPADSRLHPRGWPGSGPPECSPCSWH